MVCILNAIIQMIRQQLPKRSHAVFGQKVSDPERCVSQLRAEIGIEAMVIDHRDGISIGNIAMAPAK